MLYRVLNKARQFVTTRCLKASHMSATAGLAINDNPRNNVSPSVAAKIGKNLHHRPAHPLGIIKNRIESYFQISSHALGQTPFQIFDDLSPIVSVKQNFDELLIPPDHVSRSPSDTYYVDAHRVLRCHTSAHQTALLQDGHNALLVCGDVYRRDEVDSTHYPVFHQMEGVRVLKDFQVSENANLDEKKALASMELKKALEGLAQHLFGDVKMRWVDAYFPFTEPSAELEIFFKGEWLEVLGCGVIQDGVMEKAGREGEVGWAFGLGLERLAMVLFSIPDIRLFWSEDVRFSAQFQTGSLQVAFDIGKDYDRAIREVHRNARMLYSDFERRLLGEAVYKDENEGRITTFKPYSKYPPCFKDISFWLPEHTDFHNNDMFEVVRDVTGDLVEEIHLQDEFVHPKTGRKSVCFRITYRSMDRSLTNQEIDHLQDAVRECISSRLNVQIR